MVLAMLISHFLERLHKSGTPDESGATLVEYTLVLLLIFVVALLAMHFVGVATANSINNSGSSLFSR